MKPNSNASMEARIKNSKDLVVAVKGYSKYNPSNEKIKTEAFEAFAESADLKMTDYREAAGALINAQKENNIVFENLKSISKDVRFETGEIRGIRSAEYKSVNSIVKLITGQNISDHARMKKHIIAALKEGDPKPAFSSVSALSFKALLGNYRALTGLVRSNAFYSPTDERIKIAALDAFESSASASLINIAEKETSSTNARSTLILMLDGPEGLKDRTDKAKMHVRRKYGANSPEYKALTNRKY